MIYVEVTEPRAGEPYADFYLYLPMAASRFLQYRFVYVECPEKADLTYDVGPNDPANSRLYRIREAFVGRLSDGRFAPDYRILQYGEIGFAMKEEGAGDFVGGVHGDEVAIADFACPKFNVGKLLHSGKNAKEDYAHEKSGKI